MIRAVLVAVLAVSSSAFADGPTGTGRGGRVQLCVEAPDGGSACTNYDGASGGGGSRTTTTNTTSGGITTTNNWNFGVWSGSVTISTPTVTQTVVETTSTSSTSSSTDAGTK